MHAAGDIHVSAGQVLAHTSSITVPDNQSKLVARDLEYTRDGLASIELGQNLGGHSAAGVQANLTLTLMGDGSPSHSALAAGQRVWISRPLGSGLLFTGAMENRVRGRFIDRWCDRAVDLSYDLEGIQTPVRMTDITGFGLAGHLGSLIEGYEVQWQGDLPAYDGIDFEARPVLAASNASLAGNLIGGLSVRNHALAVDPQTLGGVLAIWPEDYQPPAHWIHVATLIAPATPKV
jgi:selenide,water dikinase